MKKIAKLIALGTMMTMLFGAGQVWAQKAKAPTAPAGEMRMELKPDLYALHFDGAKVGKEIILGAKVRNKGLKKAGSFKVKVLYKKSPKAKWTFLQHAGVAELGIGESKPLSFRHNAVFGVTYYYKMVVDYTDWVDESNESNNEKYTKVIVPGLRAP